MWCHTCSRVAAAARQRWRRRQRPASPSLTATSWRSRRPSPGPGAQPRGPARRAASCCWRCARPAPALAARQAWAPCLLPAIGDWQAQKSSRTANFPCGARAAPPVCPSGFRGDRGWWVARIAGRRAPVSLCGCCRRRHGTACCMLDCLECWPSSNSTLTVNCPSTPTFVRQVTCIVYQLQLQALYTRQNPLPKREGPCRHERQRHHIKRCQGGESVAMNGGSVAEERNIKDGWVCT